MAPCTDHPDLVEEAVRLAPHNTSDQPLVSRPERQTADQLRHLVRRT
jgi:hypothetical protein